MKQLSRCYACVPACVPVSVLAFVLACVHSVYRDKLEEHGVCVRVLGNISLLPQDVQKLIAKAVSISSHFNRYWLLQ